MSTTYLETNSKGGQSDEKFRMKSLLSSSWFRFERKLIWIYGSFQFPTCNILDLDSSYRYLHIVLILDQFQFGRVLPVRTSIRILKPVKSSVHKYTYCFDFSLNQLNLALLASLNILHNHYLHLNKNYHIIGFNTYGKNKIYLYIQKWHKT